MRSFDGPCSPRSSGAVRSRHGSLSQPASPLVRHSAGSPYPDGPYNYPPSVMFPMHPEEAYRESVGDAPLFRNKSFDAPPSPMYTWGPRMSPARGSYFGLHSHGSFPPPPSSPLHSGHPGLSPRGYWHRPPMSPGRSWSAPGEGRGLPPQSPRSPASTTALMSQRSPTMSFPFPPPYAQRELSFPVLHNHPGSPASQHGQRPLSPRSDVHSPASQRDFTPPMSPISADGRKRDEPKTIVPNPVESSSSRGKRREHLERLPPTVTISNSEDGNQDVVEWSGEDGFEVILRERSACESPEIMGDEVDKFSLNDDTSQTSPSDESMSPLPYNQEDQTAMMEISEDLLQLPIAPVGPDDEGPHAVAPKSS